jgi:hypothetical protein
MDRIRFRSMGLYDLNVSTPIDDVNGFKPVHIFSDDLGREVWVSPEKKCVTMERSKLQVAEGEYSMHIKWDKVNGGCNWIGLGFGWSDWMGKDMTGMENIAAVQMKIRAVGGSFRNLPVAFAFEDYTDIQTYCGFRMEHASGEFNDRGWTIVTVPLHDFPFERKKADLSKIKQFMIQLEGDGDIYLDDIRLIRYQP